MAAKNRCGASLEAFIVTRCGWFASRRWLAVPATAISGSRGSDRSRTHQRSCSGSKTDFTGTTRRAKRTFGQTRRRRSAKRRHWPLPPPHKTGVVCSRRVSSWIASPRRGADCGGSIMKFPRRTFLHLAMGAAALPAVPRTVRAQAYPSRPVRIVVGFPAGGATDIQARLMGQWLSDRLGQQFIVENRAGASGNIGTEAVARAPADGYTLLQVVTPHAINAALYSNLNFDFIRDIAPVICAARLAYVIVVHPSVPATTIPEFITYAKANPGKINYGSAG